MRKTLFVMFALATSALACSHNAPVAKAPPPPPAPPAEPKAPVAAAPAPAPKPECEKIRAHFAFDSAVIDEADRPQVVQAADCLLARQQTHVTIEGNADERGTVEYNIALGQRRADAVREYLERLGVDDGLIKTVSYGKLRPQCTEHTEECWRENRNAALVPETPTQPVSQRN